MKGVASSQYYKDMSESGLKISGRGERSFRVSTAVKTHSASSSRSLVRP